MSKQPSGAPAKNSDIYDLVTDHSNLTFKNVGSLLGIACRDFSVERAQFHHIVISDEDENELKAKLSDFVHEDSLDRVSLLICCDGTLDETKTYITGSTHWAALHLRKIVGKDKKITIQPYYMNSLGGDIPPVVTKVFRNDPDQKPSLSRRLDRAPSKLKNLSMESPIPLVCPEQHNGYSSGYHGVFNLIRAHQANLEGLSDGSQPREILEIAAGAGAGIAAARTQFNAHEFTNYYKNPLGKIFSEKTSDEKQAEKQPESLTSKTEGKLPPAGKAAKLVKKLQETEPFEFLTSSIYRAWVQDKTFKDRFEEIWAIKGAIQEEKNRLTDDVEHNFKGSAALKKINQSCRKIIFDLVAQRTFETSSRGDENAEEAAIRLKIKEFSEALNSDITFQKLETNQRDFLPNFPPFLENGGLLDGIEEKISTLKAEAFTAPVKLKTSSLRSKFGSLTAVSAASAVLGNPETPKKGAVVVTNATFETPKKDGYDLATILAASSNKGSPPADQNSKKAASEFISPEFSQKYDSPGESLDGLNITPSPDKSEKLTISLGALVDKSGVQTAISLQGNGNGPLGKEINSSKAPGLIQDTSPQALNLKNEPIVANAGVGRVDKLRSTIVGANEVGANDLPIDSSEKLDQKPRAEVQALVLAKTEKALEDQTAKDSLADDDDEFSPRAAIISPKKQQPDKPTFTLSKPKTDEERKNKILALAANKKREREEKSKTTPAKSLTDASAIPLVITIEKGNGKY